MALKIVRNDITKMNTEAIVNTANRDVMVGNGCDTAVYQAAGREELLQYRREKIGVKKEGDVFLTPGFGLPAKYIIHAVSPLYMNGRLGEEKKLRRCYRKSLELAGQEGIRSIAIPLIATGNYGYPKEEGLRIAVDEIHAFLLQHEMEIYLVVFDPESSALGERISPGLQSYIDSSYMKAAAVAEYGNERNDSVSSVLYDRRGKGSALLGAFGIGEKAGKVDFSETVFPEAAQPFHHEKNKEKKSAEKDIELEDIYADAAESSEDFEEVHQEKLKERIRHLSDTYSEYLMYLIESKGLKHADVWKRGVVDRKIFSKIKTNPDYHPNKVTALCLCIGAQLNLDESKDLLLRAGYALSPSDKTDVIFSYFIENEIYDMVMLDIELEEYGLPCIIE